MITKEMAEKSFLAFRFEQALEDLKRTTYNAKHSKRFSFQPFRIEKDAWDNTTYVYEYDTEEDDAK